RGGYAPMYAPGVSDPAGAVPVRVEPGEERLDIDVRVDLVPSVTVDATGATNANGLNIQAFLAAAQPGARPANRMAAGGRESANHFVWSGVTPGAYTIVAMGMPAGTTGNGGSLFAVQDLVVSGDDTSASLTLAPAATIRGHVVFDGAAQPSVAEISSVQLT